MFKKIDQLILKSFIPPFVVAYSIAAFVLLMQVLWLYIDDIAGKGLSPWLIMELLFYRSMSIIPLALPLGMLIASVMVMGNMSEKYELSSMKSAGVSLWRTMRSIVGFGLLVMLFSAYCSDTLIPIANLKFGSRMFDIQEKKPTLQLETGTFNYDFQGYAIHFKEKMGNGRTIKDVIIYDHSSTMSGEILEIVAEEGDIYTTNNGKFFVMELRNGYQYVEQRPRSSKTKGKYPYMRIGFERWRKVFDLSSFELQRTNPELFNRNRQMMRTNELIVAIDSIAVKTDKRVHEVSNYVSTYFYFQTFDSTYLDKEKFFEAQAQEAELPPGFKTDVLPKDTSMKPLNPEVKKALGTKPKQGDVKKVKKHASKRSIGGGKVLDQRDDKPVEEWADFLYGFTADNQRSLYTKAKSSMRSIYNRASASKNAVKRMRVSRVKHIYDMHMKYSMAVVCVIFVFIGAPMGAIIRKGGFGYPILVSIIFFILFVVLMIFCRRFAEKFIIPGVWAAWIPCLVLFPVGIMLTLAAMRDASMIRLDTIGKNIAGLFHFLKKTKASDDQEQSGQATT